MDTPLTIEVRDLKKHFGHTKAVDGISFSFKSGHVFGFVGPNGAGKTTTLRVMATLEEPTAGDVFMDGVSVREDPEEARRIVGFVPDTLPSHSDMTVHEYLDFFARAYGLHGKALRRAVTDVEEFTGLIGLREKLLKSLSKGMKQRVSLARSLVHDPSVLVMDEPAAGLDPRARVEFRELVLALAGLGKAILISSHILSELTEIIDGVVIIECGKLLRTGNIEEVLTRETEKHSVVIRALGELGDLRRTLLQLPGIEDVRENGNGLHADIIGSEESCSKVLSDLIQRGHEILEFKHLQTDLEDVFMRVTTGKLQ